MLTLTRKGSQNLCDLSSLVLFSPFYVLLAGENCILRGGS